MGMGIKRIPLLGGLALAVTVAWGPAALAQTSPGQVRDSLPTPTPQVPPPVRAPERPSDDGATPSRAALNSPVQVSLQAFEFDGNTLFSTAVLAELLRGYLNRPLTLGDIYEAADGVERFYAEQGYPLTSVIVPPQKITVGKVLLQVVEARVAAIRLEGNRRYRDSLLRAHLPDLEGGPYLEAPLEQGLYRLNDLPGLQARAVIRPGTTFGTSDIVVRLRERAVQGSLTVDNHGRDAIGELRATGQLRVNNPLTLGDALTLSVLGSEDGLLTYGAIDYSLPLNSAGTRIEAYYGRAEYESDDVAPIEGSSEEARIGIRQALVRSACWHVDVRAGFSDVQSGVDLISANISDTEIKLFDIGMEALRRGPQGSTQLSVRASTDFQTLNRTDLTPVNGSVEGHQRLRLQVGALHHQNLTPRWLLLLRGTAVYSPDPLLDTQAFGLGGPGSVRGYPGSEYRGDQGFSAAIDVGYRLPLTGITVMPRLFVDGGFVRRVDLPAGQGDDQDDASSAGLGLDLHFRALSLTLDWAHPLQDRVISDGETDGRMFGTLSLQF